MAKSTYRSIAKANTILGSVQILTIIIGIIRSKLVALLLGPVGVGLMGLYQSTIDLVRSATNMGISTSAVRDVAIAKGTNNELELQKTQSVISKIVWVTGALGMGVMLIGAPWLSEITFGNREYTWAFRILSIIPLIAQLTVQHNVTLQGTRAMKRLASASIWGGLVGLFINVPMFYIWGEDAIIPALIIVAVASLAIAWYNASKLNISSVVTTWSEVFTRGRSMVKMGFLIGLTGLLDMTAIYIVKIYVQKWGELAEVGLYTAGFAIVQSYVNLVFRAIGTDYYPRLSAISNNKEEYCDAINKQFEILILVLTPMVLIFMSFSSELLHLLYSTKFQPAKMMICWMAFGMLFRAYSWCPGFMFLAKSDSKLYFILYILAFALELLLYLSGYYYLGLTGIGIAFGLQYVITTTYTLVIIRHRYSFKYGWRQNRLMLISVLSGFLVLITIYAISARWGYFVFFAIILGVSFFCYKELNKRLNIVSLIKSKKVIKK